MVIFLHIAICSEMSVPPTTFILADEKGEGCVGSCWWFRVPEEKPGLGFASTPETCGTILTPEAVHLVGCFVHFRVGKTITQVYFVGFLGDFGSFLPWSSSPWKTHHFGFLPNRLKQKLRIPWICPTGFLLTPRVRWSSEPSNSKVKKWKAGSLPEIHMFALIINGLFSGASC